MYPRRIRFKQDILSEVYEPSKHNGKAIIVCSGMPSMPGGRTLATFLQKKGYLVLVPRYRGSWESGGEFLAQSPHQDVLDMLDHLKEITVDTENYYNEVFEPVTYKNDCISVIGVSFGGPAAILASMDDRVHGSIAVCPVVDWLATSETEPMGWFKDFCRRNFGNGYRFSDENWEKLASGQMYNPVNHQDNIQSHKLMVLHAEDDKVVHIGLVKKFVEAVDCKHLYTKKGGHLSSRILTKWRIWRKVKGLL